MNGPKKDNPSSLPYAVKNFKNYAKLNSKIILKWSYLEHLKQQYAKELQPKDLLVLKSQEMLYKNKGKWKIYNLEANTENIVEMKEEQELESPTEEKSLAKRNIFREYFKQKADRIKQRFDLVTPPEPQEIEDKEIEEAEPPPLTETKRQTKRNIFKEYFKQKADGLKLFTPEPKTEEEDKEIDDFVWVPESKKKSLQQKLRKHFLQDPENDVEKHIDGDDYMIDDFVVVEPDLLEDVGGENQFKQGFIDFTAGSLAGIVQVYISQPLDTVKVKQQTFPRLYGNMFKCFFETYRRYGISGGLYAGSVPAVVASVAENSVLFAAYGYCQRVVAYFMDIEKVCEMSALGNAFAGCFAAFFSAFALCPTELVKCKLQAVQEMKPYVAKNSTAKPITSFQLTRDILETEGIPGFYRGLTSTLVREMPGFFFFFGGYEATRAYLTQPNQSKEDIGPLKTMCAGAVGGICLWTTTFPADVIKSRIQINNLNGSMISVGSDIFRKEGIFAFYNGLLPTIVRTIPATAVLFLVYEYSKKVMNNAFLKETESVIQTNELEL